jgi:TM2 domain-containing membrane protein YozV
MSRYYIADGMVQRGPFEVTDLPGQGLHTETLVWKEGMAQWQRADEVEELIFAGVLPRPAPGAPMPAPVPAYYPAAPVAPYYPGASGNKIAAGICGILLGAFGVHKFILGRVGAGLVMLLLTVFTCGWAGIVMNVIGIIEGIIYLTRSDEQFYYEYVVGRKAWF